MSKLTELLSEADRTKKRLEQAIISGDFDLMTAIEREQAELTRRIYFERRNDYAERLEDLRIEKQCALELQSELADELQAAAGEVLAARSAVYDAEQRHAAIKAKQYFVDTQIDQNRKETIRVNGELNNHVKSRLSGVSGSNLTNSIDLMENNLCEI
ncbi:MAG TPA: hypothetical protein VGC97_08705 [Pyrinomonadaceae bacterium]